MRNFEERKTEIFRRSELKIKEKKQKRNRFIACCVPIMVCCVGLIAGAVVFRGPQKKDSEVTKDAAMEEVTDNSNSMIVSSNDYTIYQTSYEDTQIEEVQEIFQDIICAGKGSDPISEKDNLSVQSGSNTPDYTTENIRYAYSISITEEDGEKQTYALRENVLVNTKTKEEYVLDEEQVEKIKEILQIEGENKGK